MIDLTNVDLRFVERFQPIEQSEDGTIIGKKVKVLQWRHHYANSDGPGGWTDWVDVPFVS
jgi:hypothetical protein